MSITIVESTLQASDTVYSNTFGPYSDNTISFNTKDVSTITTLTADTMAFTSPSIATNVVGTSIVACVNLTGNSGAIVTVPAGQTLTVAGTLDPTTVIGVGNTMQFTNTGVTTFNTTATVVTLTSDYQITGVVTTGTAGAYLNVKFGHYNVHVHGSIGNASSNSVTTSALVKLQTSVNDTDWTDVEFSPTYCYPRGTIASCFSLDCYYAVETGAGEQLRLVVQQTGGDSVTMNLNAGFALCVTEV